MIEKGTMECRVKKCRYEQAVFVRDEDVQGLYYVHCPKCGLVWDMKKHKLFGELNVMLHSCPDCGEFPEMRRIPGTRKGFTHCCPNCDA